MFNGNKNHIDFRTLTKSQLRDLSNKWEDEARIFEARLESYSRRIIITQEIQEKIERLHETGNKLWARVKLLERWQINNKNRIKD